MYSIYKPTLKRIAEFLEHAPALQSLQLSCGTNYKIIQSVLSGINFQKGIKLSDITNENAYWEKLKHVSLRMSNADETELRLFLARHCKTLRTLELVNTNLLNDRRNAGRIMRASATWLDFCYFLNETMDLEKVTSADSTRLMTSRTFHRKYRPRRRNFYKDFRPYSESYTPSANLRQQIEGFVARKCPFPSVSILEHQHEDNAGDQDEAPPKTLSWSWTPNSEGVWRLSESY
jgi:hypothetical protein